MLNTMENIEETFSKNGFVVRDNLVSEAMLTNIEQHVASIQPQRAGTRNLLACDWCCQLALDLKQHPQLSSLLSATVAVQCTYFAKTVEQNWLVTLHRDYVIPVQHQFSATNWSHWSTKEGIHYVRPPKAVLNALVAVRVHLEDCQESNGPLQVVPGSHLTTETVGERTLCLVKKGGAVVMRPLILHASSKLTRGTRRVLHFLYGPPALPDGAVWAHAVM